MQRPFDRYTLILSIFHLSIQNRYRTQYFTPFFNSIFRYHNNTPRTFTIHSKTITIWLFKPILYWIDLNIFTNNQRWKSRHLLIQAYYSHIISTHSSLIYVNTDIKITLKRMLHLYTFISSLINRIWIDSNHQPHNNPCIIEYINWAYEDVWNITTIYAGFINKIIEYYFSYNKYYNHL